MPKLRTESYGGGDQSWLGSMRDVVTARTVTIDRTALTPATHFPQGYVRSGTPLAIVAGKAVPFNAAGSGGADVLAGFLLTDQPVIGAGDLPSPLLDSGRIRVSRLPVAFAVPAAGKDATTLVYQLEG